MSSQQLALTNAIRQPARVTARFLRVPPTYFFPDDAMRQDAVPAELAAALSDDKVRDMALRAAGLSDRSLQAITDMIDSARTVEGLPDDQAANADRPRG